MIAKVTKATGPFPAGSLVEVFLENAMDNDLVTNQHGLCYRCKNDDGRQHYVLARNLEIIEHSKTIDWEQRRYEIAKEIVANLFPRVLNNKFLSGEDVAKVAIMQADELITQLIITQLKKTL